jgi:subtilisin family serine protease
MSDEDVEVPLGRRPTVSDVIAVSGVGDGFAYVPGEVLVRASGIDRLTELTGRPLEPVADREVGRGDRGWMRATRVERAIEVIEVLVSEGYDSQPNHVMFAHGCGSPCPPHPADVQDLVRSGLLANPLKANPLEANPLKANPLKANHPMENTAVPVLEPRFTARELQGPGPHPRVIVLDTGLAGTTPAAMSVSGNAVDHLPTFLAGAPTTLGQLRITGDTDLPDDEIKLPSGHPPAPPDRYLDPAAGHGTFIAGIIEQLAPGCTIEVRAVIGPLGDTSQVDVGNAIHDVVEEFENLLTPRRPHILSLSFGGQAPEPPAYLREAVARAIKAGIPVIASAGNDGVCTPQYPAAFPGVIAVAAVGPDGPPHWTNYGDWVDACAPGVDLVSAFFDHFDGAFPTMNSFDPDHFNGWAQWSGTSFAVPVVVAAVARELVFCPVPPGKAADIAGAVERVVRAPYLARLPCLGTVVNI